jgi:hypothetical protein
MATFRLADLSTDAVRAFARELGLPVEPTAEKDQLIPQIVHQLGNATIGLVPMNPAMARPKAVKTIGSLLLVLIPLLSLALTAWIAYANLQTANTASNTLQEQIRKNAEDAQEKREYEWERNAVYNIIDKGMTQDFTGLTFAQILGAYEHKAMKDGIRKEKLEERALQRILLDLMSLELVYRLAEDRYIPRKHFLIRGDNSLTQNSTANAILRVLSAERGTKTVSEIKELVVKDGTVSSDDYNFVISLLIGNGMVKVTNGKVFAVGFPPESKR